MIKRHVLLGDGQWPFFALFSPLPCCWVWNERERLKEGKKRSKPELNQSYLFVLRGNTSKRVAFLTIVFLGSCLDIEARGSQPRFFKATPSRCHLFESNFGDSCSPWLRAYSRRPHEQTGSGMCLEKCQPFFWKGCRWRSKRQLFF